MNARIKASKTLPTWPDVLRALGRPVVRSYALDRFKTLGFTAVSWGTSNEATAALARALSETEDSLELNHPKWPERESIKAVRRLLETMGSRR